MALAPKGRHARQPSRQARVAHRLTAALAILLAAVLAAGAAELSRHGFAFFVFRVAGTGATSASAPGFGQPPELARRTITMPEVPRAYVLYVLPPLAHRRIMTVTLTVTPGELIFVVPSMPPAVKP